jgi:hypothetical protein
MGLPRGILDMHTSLATEAQGNTWNNSSHRACLLGESVGLRGYSLIAGLQQMDQDDFTFMTHSQHRNSFRGFHERYLNGESGYRPACRAAIRSSSGG